MFLPALVNILFASAGGRRLQQTEGGGLYEGVYQDTTTQLRSSILEGNLELATSLLTVSKDVNVNTVAAKGDFKKCNCRHWVLDCVFLPEILPSSES